MKAQEVGSPVPPLVHQFQLLAQRTQLLSGEESALMHLDVLWVWTEV